LEGVLQKKQHYTGKTTRQNPAWEGDIRREEETTKRGDEKRRYERVVS